jgi:hypothetical protein
MSSTNVNSYNMREIYGLNDKVHHLGFDETGVVKEVQKTSDDYSTCVVDFPVVGRKCLVMGVTVSQVMSSI